MWRMHLSGAAAPRLARIHALTLVRNFTGKLDLNVPPFLKLDHDPAARRLVLNIEDNEQKQQKEMWGTIYTALAAWSSTPSARDHMSLTSSGFYRHDMGIHPAVHNRRVRRTHSRPAARWYRLQSVH